VQLLPGWPQSCQNIHWKERQAILTSAAGKLDIHKQMTETRLLLLTLYKTQLKLSMAAHACNPSFLGRLRSLRSQFEANLGKKFVRPHVNQ
jgi:hypothetical protein